MFLLCHLILYTYAEYIIIEKLNLNIMWKSCKCHEYQIIKTFTPINVGIIFDTHIKGKEDHFTNVLALYSYLKSEHTLYIMRTDNAQNVPRILKKPTNVWYNVINSLLSGIYITMYVQL